MGSWKGRHDRIMRRLNLSGQINTDDENEMLDSIDSGSDSDNSCHTERSPRVSISPQQNTVSNATDDAINMRYTSS